MNKFVQESTMLFVLSKVDILKGQDEAFVAVEEKVFSQKINDNLF